MAEKVKSKVLAIDFDGVIHDIAHPVPGRRMGPPFPGAMEALNLFRMQGYKLVIFTVKAATDAGSIAVQDWLTFYGIPYDEVTAIKPNALVFIDDKAYRHTDWPSTLEFMRHV